MWFMWVHVQRYSIPSPRIDLERLSLEVVADFGSRYEQQEEFPREEELDLRVAFSASRPHNF